MVPAVPSPGSDSTGEAPSSFSSPKSGAPSALDLIRLSPTAVFPPGGESLFRQIGILTDLRPGVEVLDVACGRGVTTTFLANTFGVEGAGVDPNPALIAEAEQRARDAGFEGKVTFQAAPLDDLPYQDATFDVSIGEIALGALYHPGAAVREMARVTKPLGSVVLVQLVWTGHIDEERREILVQHLGARPMLLVEWKQLMRDAGCVDLYVEDWSDYSSPFRPVISGPFHDIAKIFSLRQKLSILRRALQRWGWRGVRGAIVREQEIHTLLTRQRVLGLTMIRGTRWPDAVTDPD